ncbi:cistern family PEP-CTERM protein [Sphingomonas crocodyli]|uniref:PEP-CTERM sorting domain-containing protein n=1 Tax=Sphingomonas crocodyli TaxID=1979270 RepID=A0A437LY10_9SPHN|nr:cistern family PEP-CTERM protein [Sphingomonas crocodyli]RVT90262.1 PEP-CTERM sorting domain-containing protein [Sphingomonas crocodyli]
MSAPVSAATSSIMGSSIFLDASDPFSFNVDFAAQGANSSGAEGEATFNFLGASSNNKVFSFSYNIANTSTGASANSRLGAFGFNTSVDNYTLATTGTAFSGMKNGGNFNGLGVHDLCFYAGPNCNGGGNNGINVALGEVNGGFTLTFASSQSSLTLTDFVARWQAAQNNGSTSGFGVPKAIPEASTWAMLMIGFGGIGLTVRSRRRQPQVALA